MSQPPPLAIRIRIHAGAEIAMGPGKADLLEAIVREGSISAAGRALGMSYRRSWMLVDAMNRCWERPLVETAAGGSHGGGARLTDLGREVLTRYRALQAQAEALAGSEAWNVLRAALREEPRETQQQGQGR